MDMFPDSPYQRLSNVPRFDNRCIRGSLDHLLVIDTLPDTYRHSLIEIQNVLKLPALFHFIFSNTGTWAWKHIGAE